MTAEALLVELEAEAASLSDAQERTQVVVTESAESAHSCYTVSRDSSSTFTMLAVRFGCAGVSWGVFDTF